jgi:diguanylate cyclase (GGDEF)-like protein
MSSAVFALVVNTAVAVLFSATFAVLASSNPSFRRLYWFALAYFVGAFTPASELLVRFSSAPQLFVATSYASFLTAFYLTAIALCRLYRLTVPWWLLGLPYVLSLLTRALIWGGPRNAFFYELAYQAPFAVAMGVCGLMIARALPRGRLDVVLCVVFNVSAAHFLIKPFLAVYFGSGAMALDYVNSLYALFSQSCTGILLTCIGLVLILVVVRKMLTEVRNVADHDALSGLLNRRGFEKHSAAALETAKGKGVAVALFMFDLDHFKRLNDTYGHEIGDWFISAFAEILRLCVPHDGVLARVGGEEFIALLVGERHHDFHELGELVRRHLLHLSHDAHPQLRVTVSAGVVTSSQALPVNELMRRADKALYLAKHSGRDRVCMDRLSSLAVPQH